MKYQLDTITRIALYMMANSRWSHTKNEEHAMHDNAASKEFYMNHGIL